MRVSIHQPHYLPWGPYIYKILMSDIFVFLDDVQFDRGDFQQRNFIHNKKTGQRILLTVPTSHVGEMKNLNETIIRKGYWEKKHLQTIWYAYHTEPYFRSVFPELENILSGDFRVLSDLNIELTQWIIGYLGIKTKILRSSSLDVESYKQERVLDIVKMVDGTEYLTGSESLNDYLSTKYFSKQGVTIKEVKFKFSTLCDRDSILDLLFAKSPSQILEQLKQRGSLVGV